MNRIVTAVACATCLLVAATGTAAESAAVPGRKAPANAAPATIRLADAYRSGALEVSVYVVPGYGDGRRLRVALKNRSHDRLRVTIPAGASTLDVGDPLPALYLYMPAARTLTLEPGKFADPVDVEQTGTLRALDGQFWLSVNGGRPQLRGSITTGGVGP